jgi:putative ABC transport system permease protein
MIWMALKMLTGDRAKYFGLIFGVTFASLLMSQQMSIFVGIMKRTGSQILDVRDADIWVMDNKVRYIDEVPGMPENELDRVRGVPGVQWAVKLYKGDARARMANGDFRSVVLMGLDDATLVGGPQEMIAGRLGDLRRPDAVVIDKAGCEYLWPDEVASIKTEGYKLGREFEMNDHRCVLVGVCKASPPFTTLPVVYTTYTQTTSFIPPERDNLTFILAKPAPGVAPEEVCNRIHEQTGRMALTHEQFFWKTIVYFMTSTGIPVNFGITIFLGFFVGVAIAGQTFYLFTVENLKHFGSLKAMGLGNLRIVGMILFQALVVGVIGYAFGIGLTAIYFLATNQRTQLAGLNMIWPVMVGTGAAVMLIVVLASLISIRKVLVLEPAVVFRG